MGPTSHAPGPQGTVLLVDDEELLRRLLSRMLSDAGFAVVEAENGAAALEAAKRLDGALRLVVTDIHMPVMDGLGFAQEFRPTHPDVPIIYISGRDLEESFTPQVTGWELLRKPFKTEVFLGTVERMLRHQT